MTAGTNPSKTLYPFAELFRVDTSTTTAVIVWDIPKGTIITLVMAKMFVAGTGSGNIIVGDTDDDNGYVLAADATAASDVVYGDAFAERGAYTYEATASHGFKPKVYTSAAKQITMTCSGTLTTEATVDVLIFGYRYSED